MGHSFHKGQGDIKDETYHVKPYTQFSEIIQLVHALIENVWWLVSEAMGNILGSILVQLKPPCVKNESGASFLLRSIKNRSDGPAAGA